MLPRTTRAFQGSRPHREARLREPTFVGHSFGLRSHDQLVIPRSLEALHPEQTISPGSAPRSAIASGDPPEGPLPATHTVNTGSQDGASRIREPEGQRSARYTSAQVGVASGIAAVQADADASLN